MGDRLRLGIAGCGEIAGYMAWFARLNRRIELVACCDAAEEKAKRFAGRHHIGRAHASYEAMLDQGGMDAVYLAVPHHLHFDMLGAAIRAGLQTLVEKPITRTLAEAEMVVALTQERGVRVAVNYQYRYDRGCHALARAVQNGALGRIHYARCNVPWRRGQSYFEGAGWHGSWAQAGGGTLITQGSHAVDVLLWALGERPVEVMGYTAQRRFDDVEVEDLTQAMVVLEDGAIIQVSSTMVANPEQSVTMEVYGERGTALYSGRPWPHVRFRGVRARRAKVPSWGVHALQRSLNGFCAWAMDGVPHLVPAEEAVAVLAVVEAAYRSAESGRAETVAGAAAQS
jgi:predicted dehydrogenase